MRNALKNTRRTSEEMGRTFSEIFNKDDKSVGSNQEMWNVEEEEDNVENENKTEVLGPSYKNWNTWA